MTYQELRTLGLRVKKSIIWIYSDRGLQTLGLRVVYNVMLLLIPALGIPEEAPKLTPVSSDSFAPSDMTSIWGMLPRKP